MPPSKQSIDIPQLDKPDTIIVTPPQWEAIQDIRDSYGRVGTKLTAEAAYQIWVKRGMPVKEKTR